MVTALKALGVDADLDAALRRLAVAIAASWMVVALTSCSQTSPSVRERPEGPAMPPANETTQPTDDQTQSQTEETPVYTKADVAITVGDLSIAYEIGVCPVTAWLDPAIPDSVEFGTYPDRVPGSDGNEWATQMVLLSQVSGQPNDWSFYLSTALSRTPLSSERLLVSRPEGEDFRLTATMLPGKATIVGGFRDSLQQIDTTLLPGAVTLTCR